MAVALGSKKCASIQGHHLVDGGSAAQGALPRALSPVTSAGPVKEALEGCPQRTLAKYSRTFCQGLTLPFSQRAQRARAGASEETGREGGTVHRVPESQLVPTSGEFSMFYVLTSH